MQHGSFKDLLIEHRLSINTGASSIPYTAHTGTNASTTSTADTASATHTASTAHTASTTFATRTGTRTITTVHASVRASKDAWHVRACG